MGWALARSCSSCAYWEPYPGMEGAGTCDQELSERYGRLAVGNGDSCDHYAPSDTAPSVRAELPHRETACSGCHYWLPFEPMSHVGLCDNPDSTHFEDPEFDDKPAEGCFVVRSLEGLEFAWCQSHRQTIHASEFPAHVGCSVFVSTASLPVEDEIELTLAGD